MTAPSQFQVMLAIPQQGPKGGKRPAKIEIYNVAATSREEARAAFAEELPDMVQFIASCGACECRVMRGR
jgi:hypothetical protein